MCELKTQKTRYRENGKVGRMFLPIGVTIYDYD